MPDRYARSDARSRAFGRRDIAVCICLVAIGLFGWRAVATFTSTPAQSNAPALTALVETVTGADTTRIAIADTGAALILIDGQENGLSAADAAKIRQFAAALTPDAPPPIIRQYPFASGIAARPGQGALIELGLLGLLAALSAWFLISSGRAGAPIASTSPIAANDETPHADERASLPATPLRPVAPASLTAPSPQIIDQAGKMAGRAPKETARIIRQWLRQDESKT